MYINKYKPESSNDIIGNKKAIQSIKNWLNNIDEIKKMDY